MSRFIKIVRYLCGVSHDDPEGETMWIMEDSKILLNWGWILYMLLQDFARFFLYSFIHVLLYLLMRDLDVYLYFYLFFIIRPTVVINSFFFVSWVDTEIMKLRYYFECECDKISVWFLLVKFMVKLFKCTLRAIYRGLCGIYKGSIPFL